MLQPDAVRHEIRASKLFRSSCSGREHAARIGHTKMDVEYASAHRSVRGPNVGFCRTHRTQRTSASSRTENKLYLLRGVGVVVNERVAYFVCMSVARPNGERDCYSSDALQSCELCCECACCVCVAKRKKGLKDQCTRFFVCVVFLLPLASQLKRSHASETPTKKAQLVAHRHTPN